MKGEKSGIRKNEEETEKGWIFPKEGKTQFSEKNTERQRGPRLDFSDNPRNH